jgi:hypothetical protein
LIDTVEMGWVGGRPGLSELAHFEKQLSGSMRVESLIRKDQRDQAEEHQVKWHGKVEGLGTVQLNADGYLRIEGRSLAKTRMALIKRLGEEEWLNHKMLTADQANDTLQVLASEVEKRFPWLEEDQLRVSRVDVVYQRRVPDSMAVIKSLVGAVKPTRKGCAWFDNARGVPTGVMFRGVARAHRAYDKGLEGGDRKYTNVLRSEEQLRSRAAPFGEIIDVSQRIFNRDACRNVLNERYLDVAYDGELDVTSLVKAGSDTMALLVLHPELMGIYKERVKENAFYKMKKKIRDYRASAVPVDLRVPPDAWLEEEDEEYIELKSA